MKSFFKQIICVVVALLATSAVWAQESTGSKYALSGKVVDEAGAPLEFATVLAFAGSEQAGGCMTDAEGVWELQLPAGDYRVEISYVGYSVESVEVSLSAPMVMEAVVLNESQEIDVITVSAQLLRREADRFILDVANNPTAAAGQTTYEMLRRAPGVWADDNGITINGRSGVMVQIGERIINNMSAEELANYLRSIPADNIQSIEVIPIAGADYEASFSGGVIKINLKRARNQGVEGSVGMIANFGPKDFHYLTPSARISYNREKLNLYGSASFSDQAATTYIESVTDYDNGTKMNSFGDLRGVGDVASGQFGAIYSFDDKNTVGAEVNYTSSATKMNTLSTSSLLGVGAQQVDNDSRYQGTTSYDNMAATFNYVRNLDQLGSTFKIIADYSTNVNTSNTDYINRQKVGAIEQDSVYRNATDLDYRIFALSAAWDKRMTNGSSLRAGAKITDNKIYSSDIYSALDETLILSNGWVELPDISSITDYRERVAALYSTYNTQLGKVALSAGVRGEYTSMKPTYEGLGQESESFEKEFFNLFPTLAMSMPLNDVGSNILSLTASRKVSYPYFGSMGPRRTLISEYAAAVGNPELRPSYTTSFALTTVLGYRYTLSVGADFQRDVVQQVAMVDPDFENVLLYKQMNVGRYEQYYAMVSAPLQVTGWWMLNPTLTAINMATRISDADSLRRMWVGQAQLVSQMTLPKNWTIEATGLYVSGVIQANQEVKSIWSTSLGVKKQMLDRRLTAAAEIVCNNPQIVISRGEGFVANAKQWSSSTKWSAALSLTYNFRAGKQFRSVTVESGAAEEKARMGN